MANENLVKKLGSETGKERRKRFMQNNLSESEKFALENNNNIRNYLVSLGDSASYNNPFNDEFIEKEVLGEVIQEFQKDPDKLFSPLVVAEELIRQGQKMRTTSLNALKEKDGNENTVLIYPLSSDARLMESSDSQLRAQGYKNFINYTKAIVSFLRDPELEIQVYKSGQNPISVKGSFAVLEYNTHIQAGQLGHKHIVINSRAYDKLNNTLSNEMGPNDTNFYDALGVYLTKRILESDLITDKQKQDTANNPEGFKILPSNASITKSSTNNTVNQVNQAIQQTIKPTPSKEELDKSFEKPDANKSGEYDDDFNPFENDNKIKMDEQNKIKEDLEHLKSIQQNNNSTSLMKGILDQFGITQDDDEEPEQPKNIHADDEDNENENEQNQNIEDVINETQSPKHFVGNNDSRKQNEDISREVDNQLKEVIEKAKNLIRIKQLAVSNEALIDLAEKAQRANVELISEKESLEDVNETLKENISSLNTTVETLTESDNKNKETIVSLNESIEDLRKDVDLRDQKLIENSTQIETLNQEVSNLTQEKTELEEENTGFKNDIATLNETNAKLSSEIETLTESVNELTTANTSLTKQKEMLERQVKTAKEDRDTYKANAEKAETDRTAAITEKNKAITDLSNAQTEHTTEINKIKRENAEALSTLESGKNAEIDELKKQIRDLQNNALDTQTEHKKATSQLEEQHQAEIKKEKDKTQSFKDDLSVVMKVFFERAPELMSKEQFEEILKQTKNIDASKISDHYFDNKGKKPTI